MIQRNTLIDYYFAKFNLLIVDFSVIYNASLLSFFQMSHLAILTHVAITNTDLQTKLLSKAETTLSAGVSFPLLTHSTYERLTRLIDVHAPSVVTKQEVPWIILIRALTIVLYSASIIYYRSEAVSGRDSIWGELTASVMPILFKTSMLSWYCFA